MKCFEQINLYRQSRLVVLMAGGGRWGKVVIAKEYRMFFRGDENILKLTEVMMVAYICEYTIKTMHYTV